MKSEYIEFRLKKKLPKTNVWEVVETRNGAVLGEIRWWGGWRQYVFFPCDETFYSWDCLFAISEFVRAKMHERKNNQRSVV